MTAPVRIAVLDDYQRVALRYADWSVLGEACSVEVFDHHLGNENEAAEALRDFDVLCMMRERMPLPGALIERLPKLKLVVVTGARTQSIDLDAAVRRGVTVCHTRGGESKNATPELAWALILACARSLPGEHQRIRQGEWQHSVGTALGGKTLGLVGLGHIGSRMARIAQAFEMDVLAWSPNLTLERASACGARRVEKEELFTASDVVSIHLVLGESTRGLVGADDLARMKPEAILVNTARGPIVNEAALIDALKAGGIRAGLDVFDVEPLPADHPFRSLPNLVTTPHLGYVTEGTYRFFFEDTVENIRAWSEGRPLRILAAPASASHASSQGGAA